MKFWALKQSITKVKASWDVTPYRLVPLYILCDSTFNYRTDFPWGPTQMKYIFLIILTTISFWRRTLLHTFGQRGTNPRVPFAVATTVCTVATKFETVTITFCIVANTVCAMATKFGTVATTVCTVATTFCTVATTFYTVGPKHLWVLSAELASRHLPGA